MSVHSREVEAGWCRNLLTVFASLLRNDNARESNPQKTPKFSDGLPTIGVHIFDPEAGKLTASADLSASREYRSDSRQPLGTKDRENGIELYELNRLSNDDGWTSLITRIGNEVWRPEGWSSRLGQYIRATYVDGGSRERGEVEVEGYIVASDTSHTVLFNPTTRKLVTLPLLANWKRADRRIENPGFIDLDGLIGVGYSENRLRFGENPNAFVDRQMLSHYRNPHIVISFKTGPTNQNHPRRSVPQVIYGEVGLREVTPGYSVLEIRKPHQPKEKSLLVDLKLLDEPAFFVGEADEMQKAFGGLKSSHGSRIDFTRAQRQELVERITEKESPLSNEQYLSFMRNQKDTTLRMLIDWLNPQAALDTFRLIEKELGSEFIFLLSDPGIAGRLYHFINFVQSQQPRPRPVEAWRAYRDFLGEAEIYVGTLMTEVEIQSVKREGFIPPVNKGGDHKSRKNALVELLQPRRYGIGFQGGIKTLRFIFSQGLFPLGDGSGRHPLFFIGSESKSAAAWYGMFRSFHEDSENLRLWIIKAKVPVLSIIPHAGVLNAHNRTVFDGSGIITISTDDPFWEAKSRLEGHNGGQLMYAFSTDPKEQRHNLSTGEPGFHMAWGISAERILTVEEFSKPSDRGKLWLLGQSQAVKGPGWVSTTFEPISNWDFGMTGTPIDYSGYEHLFD